MNLAALHDDPMLRLPGSSALWLASRNGHLAVVKLLLEHKANVLHSHMNLLSSQIANIRGHDEVAELLKRCEEAVSAAQEGRLSFFRNAIAAGSLPAPLNQWAPKFSQETRDEFLAWLFRSMQDSRSCYVVLYQSTACPSLDSPVHEEDVPLRSRITHNGLIRSLIISFLVYPNADTRRIIRELSSTEVVLSASPP
jgi:hypothetical protein